MGTYNRSYKSTYRGLRGLISAFRTRVISTLNLQVGLRTDWTLYQNS